MNKLEREKKQKELLRMRRSDKMQGLLLEALEWDDVRISAANGEIDEWIKRVEQTVKGEKT